MSIGAEEVRHIARLAEIAVSEAELPRLVSQLNRIVEYVAQLERLGASAPGDGFQPGPPAVRLREDVVAPWPMLWGPEPMAPEMAEHLFLVPRRDTGGEA